MKILLTGGPVWRTTRKCSGDSDAASAQVVSSSARSVVRILTAFVQSVSATDTGGSLSCFRVNPQVGLDPGPAHVEFRRNLLLSDQTAARKWVCAAIRVILRMPDYRMTAATYPRFPRGHNVASRKQWQGGVQAIPSGVIPAAQSSTMAAQFDAQARDRRGSVRSGTPATVAPEDYLLKCRVRAPVVMARTSKRQKTCRLRSRNYRFDRCPDSDAG
jgi:hypothetical protein